MTTSSAEPISVIIRDIELELDRLDGSSNFTVEVQKERARSKAEELTGVELAARLMEARRRLELIGSVTKKGSDSAAKRRKPPLGDSYVQFFFIIILLFIALISGIGKLLN